MGNDRSRRRIVALRLSMFAALGLPPLACGGATSKSPEPGDAPQGGRSTNGPKPGGTTPGQDNPPSGTGASIATGGSGSGSTIGTAGQFVGVGGAVPPMPTCTVVSVDDFGLVTCAEGYQERVKAVSCDVVGGAPGIGGESAGPPPRADGSVLCGDDPQICDQFELGYCNTDAFGADQVTPVCLSGCLNDSDCGQGSICICGAPQAGGRCTKSNCTTSDDCNPGYRCASYENICGPGAFACQQPQDACLGSKDCDGGQCLLMGDYRGCEFADCGRPFLVDQRARVAPALAGGAWSSEQPRCPQVAHLTELERAQLAQHWTKLGQMEHASIAAFARFSLQLLSLGAPPELVEGCTRALADETAHARLCFELASAYAGRPVGPGALDIDGSLAVTSLADIVDLVIAEGCFGETRAALEALEAAELAADPVIRDAYMRIAHDEQRHAELAFQFVRWALGRDKLLVGERLRLARRHPPIRHHGALQVALPCFDALLNRAPATSTQELFT